MSLDPLTIAGKISDRNILETLEKWQEILNVVVTAHNNGATKVFNTSAAYAVTVSNGTITGVS